MAEKKAAKPKVKVSRDEKKVEYIEGTTIPKEDWSLDEEDEDVDAEKAKISRTSRTKKNDLDKAFDGMSILFVSLVLKLFSDAENPMTPPDIRNKLANIIPYRMPLTSKDSGLEKYYEENAIGTSEHFGEKYAKSTLENWDKLVNYRDDPAGKKIAPLLKVALGGNIRVSASKVKKKYYFDPILSVSDISTLVAAVQSNRYLDDDQKDHLIDQLSILHPAYRKKEGDWPKGELEKLSTLADFFRTGKTKEVDRKNSILENIQKLYTAIVGRYKVEIDYGEYKKDPDSDQVIFASRYTKDRPTRVISPYAMFWNDGEYYLLAKYEGHDNLAHLRVDRIISIDPYRIPDLTDPGQKRLIPEPRAPYPKEIEKEYFTLTQQGEPDKFNTTKYANDHPRMAIYYNPNRIMVQFECNNNSIHLLTDNFGTDFRLEERKKPIATDTTIIDNRSAIYYVATIKNVQYENARDFAISHARDLTVISPLELVKEVKDDLRKIMEKYERVPEK